MFLECRSCVCCGPWSKTFATTNLGLPASMLSKISKSCTIDEVAGKQRLSRAWLNWCLNLSLARSLASPGLPWTMMFCCVRERGFWPILQKKWPNDVADPPYQLMMQPTISSSRRRLVLRLLEVKAFTFPLHSKITTLKISGAGWRNGRGVQRYAFPFHSLSGDPETLSATHCHFRLTYTSFSCATQLKNLLGG